MVVEADTIVLIGAVFQSPVASVWWPWERSEGLVDYEEIAALAKASQQDRLWWIGWV